MSEKKYIKVSLYRGSHSIPIGVAAYTWPDGDDGPNLDGFKRSVEYLLPAEYPFNYVTKDGHQITRPEVITTLRPADIAEDGILYVARQQPLLGVMLHPNETNLGVISVSMDSNLRKLRDVIQNQVVHSELLLPDSYLFVCSRLKCPVSVSQETCLTTLDIVDNDQVHVTLKSMIELPTLPEAVVAKKPSLSEAVVQKKIYLSYVSEETDTLVSALQFALKRLGFKVYTDSQVNDEISSSSESSDHDYINKYLQKAAVFVPIVSSRYGKTSVTNLAVKHADSLGKFIIPLNLNPRWPPNCLAIQFANVQYIQWEVKGSVEKSASKMAAGIAEVMEMNQEAMAPKLAKASQKRTSYPQIETRSLLVTICHLAQASFHSYVKEHLEKNKYAVWSSLELEAKGTVSANSANSANSALFQKKVQDCSVVVCIISKDFCCDISCEQLVYFSQHRKKIIPVVYEDVEMPCWVSMLVGTEEFIDGRGQTFDEILLKHVKQALNPDSISAGKREERELKRLQQELHSQLPDGKCVYISGGSQFYSPNGQAICNLLGKELAKQKSPVIVVTGGLFGIEDAVAKSYYDKHKKLGLPINLFHALAVKDPADKSRQIRQRADGTMEPAPYGETIFLGNSVRQTSTVTTRVMNICVLIEGGPTASYEVQQFAWNGAIVIPVKSTGGAAGGKFHVPSSIFQRPPGVSESLWSVLSDESATVADIVDSLIQILGVCFKSFVSKKEPPKKK